VSLRRRCNGAKHITEDWAVSSHLNAHTGHRYERIEAESGEGVSTDVKPGEKHKSVSEEKESGASRGMRDPRERKVRG
jgi:hypothetical protein